MGLAMFDSFEGLCNARWFRFSFLLSSRVKIDQDARSYLRRTISVGLLSYAESPPLCRREMKLLLSASLTSGRLSLSGTESGQKHVLMWKKSSDDGGMEGMSKGVCKHNLIPYFEGGGLTVSACIFSKLQ